MMTFRERAVDLLRRIFDPREQPPEFEVQTALDCLAIGALLGFAMGAVQILIRYFPFI